MIKTKATLGVAGVIAAALATGLTFFGVTGSAMAIDTSSVGPAYCYQNPPGERNSERIHLRGYATAYEMTFDDPSNNYWILDHESFNENWDSNANAYVLVEESYTHRTVTRKTEAEMTDLVNSISNNPSKMCSAFVGWDYGTGE
jgi:hypothetical protein